MIWLTRDMVEAFHRESLVRFGGADGLRDEGLLLSALARPENMLACEPDADVFRLAAAYCAGIVKNHPFIDGNKRTAFACTYTFLAINGIEITANAESTYAFLADLYEENNKFRFEALEQWLRNNTERFS